MFQRTSFLPQIEVLHKMEKSKASLESAGTGVEQQVMHCPP